MHYTPQQIARIAGKQHKNVIQSIRSMEPAWVKNTGLNFELSSYRDSTGRVLPCYVLTKMESLFIATKFNDEARARLVMRWAELEARELDLVMVHVTPSGDGVRCVGRCQPLSLPAPSAS